MADHQHGRRISHADPLSPCRKLGTEGTENWRRREAPAAEPGDNPLVRAVGRLPAKVHTKLLVAFVGTAVLVVAVGVLGLRVLGQSNDSVGTLGALQERPSPTASSRATRRNVRLLLAENVGLGLLRGQPRRVPTDREDVEVAIDLAVDERACADPARDPRRQPRLRASRRGRARPSPDPAEERRLSTAMQEIIDRQPRRPARSSADPPSTGPSSSPSTSTSSPRCSPMPRRRRPTT